MFELHDEVTCNYLGGVWEVTRPADPAFEGGRVRIYHAASNITAWVEPGKLRML